MKELEENLTHLYGVQGKQFWSDLPRLIEDTKIKYGLSDLKPIKNLSYHYVLSGFQGSQPIILKLGLDTDDLKHEAVVLKAFTGLGAVKVLDENDGMLLLERAISGISLKSFFPKRDNEAIAIACECLKKLHQAPVPTSVIFPHIKDWLKIIHQDINIPTPYLHKARTLESNLINSLKSSVLLHGDLHHDNILKNGDRWVVIDPKGVLGDPAYEVAAFICNPIPKLLTLDNPLRIIRNRVARFSEILEISEERILDWCFVQAVLAWAWTLEDGGDASYFMQVTEIFDKKMTITITDKAHIHASLVRKLIATQFPQWAHLPIKPVALSGWDNRSFHLGEDMIIRLPSAECYARQPEIEQYWLPKLAPNLPISIPMSLAMGKPSKEYLWHWSINRWLQGQTASIERIKDLEQFAIALAKFLLALQRCDTKGGPMAGPHNFYRGGALVTYDAETRQAIASIEDKNLAKELMIVWEKSLISTWQQPLVWVHGDIAVGNLLIQHGQLSAVIDFGQLCIGDPACDLAIAWTLFTGKSRDAFRATIKLDNATWERARGWALWKALCCAFPGEKRMDWRVINEVLTTR